MGKLSSAKKLTNTEKYSIEGMHDNGMSKEEISKALARNVDLISQYLEEYASEPKEEKRKRDERGIAVMTEAKSQQLDSLRQNMEAKPRHSAIHTIN